ncbi:MAG: PAS domain-containing protein [Candidatus Zixiibacteriota bacterium]
MQDSTKTREQLFEELAELRARLRELEASDSAGLAAQTLEERSALLDEAERIGGLGSWSWDVRTGRVEWSDNLCAIHGLEPGEFDGQFDTAISMIHPADIGYVEQNTTRLLKK